MVETESPGDPPLRLAIAAVNPRREYTRVSAALALVAFVAAVLSLKNDFDRYQAVDVEDDALASAAWVKTVKKTEAAEHRCRSRGSRPNRHYSGRAGHAAEHLVALLRRELRHVRRDCFYRLRLGQQAAR